MSEQPSVDEEKRTTLRRFAALGTATPLVGLGSRNDTDTGNSETRAAIRGYLATTPGAHFSKIRDDLKLGTGETQHHLRRLVEAGAVETRKDGDYRRYFTAGQFSDFEQVALGYLRRETARGVLLALIRDPTATGSDIARALDVSRATVSTTAKELDAVGLLSRADGYAVRNPETVLTLLVRFADSFGEDAVAFASEAADFIRFEPQS
ncbi:winged helix-turn-helix transcriptional regulator [Salinigranum halophilum]|jgi:predicted transcriptional regulator|uniref:winged helix-turn-helix transcriptional regulator n=1 Tax=Salinigranum halophilum TaxID=2565931 RepID=UPI00115EDA91|nr:MarR family transcriptional regulator [Salinigranum halophilum]